MHKNTQTQVVYDEVKNNKTKQGKKPKISKKGTSFHLVIFVQHNLFPFLDSLLAFRKINLRK